MKKVFISQPMYGKSNEEIIKDRERIINLLKENYANEEIEIIDSFFMDAPIYANPLWFLGKSIMLLSIADIVVFAKGWRSARGCKIEFKCAKEYGISYICED